MPRGAQSAANDLQQLQFQVDHAREECEYLRKYIVLTRMLRRAEDALTEHIDYSRSGILTYTTRVVGLRARRDNLIRKMVEEIQLNEVLDDYEGKIERELA